VKSLHALADAHQSPYDRKFASVKLRRAYFCALAAIVIGAAALRFTGLRFGLPAEFRPDEDFVANKSLGILAGELDVDFFFWPSFYFYFVAPIYATLITARHLLDIGPWPLDRAVAAAAGDPTPYLLTIRVLGALFGTACVMPVWALARRVVGMGPALVAALLAAVSFLSVRESHFGLQDSPAALVVAFALLSAAVARSRRSLLWWLAAGAAAGAAAALKYHPGLVLVPVALLAATRGWKPFCVTFAAAGGSLVLLSPMLFIRPQPVLASAASHLLGLGKTEAVEPALRWYLEHVLGIGIGFPALALAMIGGARAVWRRDAIPLFLLVHVFTTLLVLARGSEGYFRYMLPLVPPLCVLSAYGLAGLSAIAGRLVGRWAGVTVLLGSALIASIPSLSRDIVFDRLLLKPDTRELAYEWALSNLPPGTRIATSYFGGPFHDQKLVETNNPTGDGPAKGLVQNRLAPFSVILLDDADPESAAAELDPGEVDVIILPSRFPHQQLTRPPPPGKILLWLRPAPGAHPIYDRSDGFYVPIDRFEGVVRPGPEIVVVAPHGAGA
jgi:hypothetical protein